MRIRTPLLVITALLLVAPLGAQQKWRSIGPVNTSGRIGTSVSGAAMSTGVKSSSSSTPAIWCGT